MGLTKGKKKKLRNELWEIITDDWPAEPVAWSIIWECITREGSYGLGKHWPGLTEDDVKEALAKMVEKGKLVEGPARGDEKGWMPPPPKVHEFIQRIEAEIGTKPADWPVSLHVKHCGDYTDFEVPIEYHSRRDDSEEWAQRKKDAGTHTLTFRHIHEWGDAWLVLLEEHGRCYEQSTYDEDDESKQPDSPEKAMADLIYELSHEIGRLEKTRSALVKAFNRAGGLGKV